MKGRERNIFQKNHNYKVIVVIMIGLAISSIGVYAITTIAGDNITYSNSKSGLNSTNVQGAIDELYEKAKGAESIKSLPNIVTAYTYSETGSNKCVTGEESTCKRTTCYETKTANSCSAGTIIKYKVNDITIVNFHVLFDQGSTMTLQSQKNIVKAAWNSNNDITKGPITALNALEKAIAGWTNVNNQTYTLGTTNLSGKGAYTGCDGNLDCITNTYTLPPKTAKARMITLQEAKALGCSKDIYSCPKYLTATSNAYWTSSTSINATAAYHINGSGGLDNSYVDSANNVIRAVVVISK